VNELQGSRCAAPANSAVRVTVRESRGRKVQADAIGGDSKKLDTITGFELADDVKANDLEALGGKYGRAGSFVLCHLVDA
jgi:hypothetical protein